METKNKRTRQRYDHRLRELVRHTGDPNVVAALGVPRSTALSWLKKDNGSPVITDRILDMDSYHLQAEVLALRKRIQKLNAIIGLLRVLIEVMGIRLDHQRVPEGGDKMWILRAIDRSRKALPLQNALRVLRLSAARFHRWQRNEQPCGLNDQLSCPRSTPCRLTTDEIRAIKEMAESPDYRHLPTGRLAILAQRIDKVFASPTTWYQLIGEHRWRRPRQRLHPAAPKQGLRATCPNEYWHTDTTLITLLDHTKVYLQAVIDNFSRKILAWRVSDQLNPLTTVEILKEAANQAVNADNTLPKAVVDAGVENVNHDVDELVTSGWLRRVVALKDITFSTSMIESWWHILKHQ